MRRVLPTVLGLLLCTGTALADEPVPIGDLVADPDTFHFKIVILQGAVSHVTPLPPYSPTPDTTCYGAYAFTLKDDSGAVDVSVLGICGRPLLREPEVRDGERIQLTAQILSPNRMTSAKKGEDKKLRVIANAITHLAQETAPSEGAATEKPKEPAKTDDGGRPAGDSGY